jgi:hypothetical protein
MLVMNTRRFPMDTWLPGPPLIPYKEVIRDSCINGRGPYMKFTEACPTPVEVAEWIDRWYGRDIREYSIRGREWAKQNSWEVLLPVWRRVLES